jgi:hypothetical protein
LKGPQGDIGAQGAKGPQGFTGPQGLQGQKGESALGSTIGSVSPGFDYDSSNGLLTFENGGETYVVHMYVSGSY